MLLLAAPAWPEELTAESKRIDAHVLLVEDNLINRRVALAMLTSLNFRVTVAINAAEAVDRFGAQFDLILMDCHMPEMDGFAATTRIRELGAESCRTRIPIIAMTANVFESERQDCLAVGTDDHLPKPYKKAQLSAMLERWLGADAIKKSVAHATQAFA